MTLSTSPARAQRFDFETELVFRISRLGRHIEERFAHRYYDAVGLGIDFTARDLQDKLVKEGRPWEICKGFDYSAATSQMVPLSDLPPVANLHFSLDINGERRQEATANRDDFLRRQDHLLRFPILLPQNGRPHFYRYANRCWARSRRRPPHRHSRRANPPEFRDKVTFSTPFPLKPWSQAQRTC